MKKSRDELENDIKKKGNVHKSSINKRNTVVELTKVALFVAVFCILAPHTVFVPFSPIGITMGNLLLYLTAFLLGPRLGFFSVFLYLCMGFFGLPVFSGYLAGAGVLFGPTGGFLIGYLPCVTTVGLFCSKRCFGTYGMVSFVVGMIVGTLVLYGFGLAWFLLVYSGGISFWEAVRVSVIPFLPFDGIKILLAVGGYKPLCRLKRYV